MSTISPVNKIRVKGVYYDLIRQVESIDSSTLLSMSDDSSLMKVYVDANEDNVYVASHSDVIKIAGEDKTLTEKIYDLHYRKSQIDLSAFQLRDTVITYEQIWGTTTSWKHKIIPCNPNEKYKIVANDNFYTRYAWLTDDTHVSGETPAFCEDTESIRIEASENINIVAPSDAVYLYISCKSSSNENLEPNAIYKYEEIIVPTVDETLSIEGAAADAKFVGEHFSNVTNNVNNINDKLGNIETEQTEEIQPDLLKYNISLVDGKFVNGSASSYGHCIIKLEIEDKYIDFTTLVRGNNTYYNVYGFTDDSNNMIDRLLTSYSVQEYKDFHVKKPDGATKLWIACADYVNNNFITYKITKIKDVKTELDKLEEKISDEDISNRVQYPMSLFFRVAVIGASWDSGYFYTTETGGTHELNNHSWLANVARLNGIPFYTCMAKRSASTRRWLGLEKDNVYETDESYNPNDYLPSCKTRFNNTDACDLYIINLQGNDISKHYNNDSNYLGSIEDIDTTDYNNADSYYGNYSKIISMIKEKAPDARIVCTYYLYEGISNQATRELFIKAIEDICELQAPDGIDKLPTINWCDDKWFKEYIYQGKAGGLLGSHPTSMQLGGIALAFERLMSKCIADNYDYFNKWYNHYT